MAADQTINLNTLNERVTWIVQKPHRNFRFGVALASGAWGATVITIKFSLNGTTWYSAGITLAAAGVTIPIELKAVRYVAAEVTTAAGGTGTATVSMVSDESNVLGNAVSFV
jgi:hypothetical protein